MLGALLVLSLSQAPTPEAPPVEPPPAPAASAQCEGCSLTPKDVPSKTHLLERQLRDLDVRIAAVNESWPPSSVMLMFVGVSFGPLCTVFGAWMTAVGAAAIPALLVPGIVMLVVGVVGVAVLVLGALQASRHTDDARAERAALTKERDKVQAELDASPHAARMTPAAPLFALEF